jgi:hypothetical protein
MLTKWLSEVALDICECVVGICKKSFILPAKYHVFVCLQSAITQYILMINKGLVTFLRKYIF